MYTQCPDCRAVYQVSTEHLRQANGQVKCGQCDLQFNALLHLSDTIPTRAAETGERQLEPEPQPARQHSHADGIPEATPQADTDATGGDSGLENKEESDELVGSNVEVSADASTAHAEIEPEPEWQTDKLTPGDEPERASADDTAEAIAQPGAPRAEPGPEAEWQADTHATDVAPEFTIVEESNASAEDSVESVAQAGPNADAQSEATADPGPDSHLEPEAGDENRDEPVGVPLAATSADSGDSTAAESLASGTDTRDENDRDEANEEGEYGTWLKRLNQHWDPTQTGSHDAWSRAAPQAETSASDVETDQDPDPERGQTDSTESGSTADESVSAEHIENESAQAESESEPAPASSAPVQGLDTGISYIESWAEELLAEVERDDAEKDRTDAKPERHHADSVSEPDTAIDPAVNLAEETDTAALMPSDESTADHDAVEVTGQDADQEIDRSADETADQAAAPDTDQDPAQIAPGLEGTGPEPMPESRDLEIAAHEPALLDAETDLAQPETTDETMLDPAQGNHPTEDQPGTDSGEGAQADTWLEATWATDTQPSQPEAWLEPEFLDAQVLPEKLEGSGPDAGEESDQHEPEITAQDQADPGPADPDSDGGHVVTDRAIPPVANETETQAGQISDDWPAFDDSSVIEDIVLESDEAEEADQTIAVAAAGEPETAVRKTTSLLASGAESTGKVQAAAVQVSTDPQFAAKETAEEDMEMSPAESAEQVARDLGLPHRRPILRWAGRLLVLLIILVLLAVGVHSQRGVLMRNPSLAPTLTSAYQVLELEVQPDWEISAFDIVDSSARSEGNDLVVEAAFTNTAEFAQPYPVLRVTLENRWGQAIGQEDFLPRNYLRAYSAGRLMGAAERARAEVTLRSPGTAAEGFSVDVCLESPGGRLQCLSDRR